MGKKNIFGYNPKKRVIEEYTIIESFCRQLGEKSNIKHSPETEQKLVMQEIAGIEHEDVNDISPVIKEANKVQDDMMQKQCWYILEHMTMGTLNYLQVRNLKSDKTVFTPESFKHYIEELNPGYSQEELDQLVEQATLTENVSVGKTNAKIEDLEKVYSDNVEGNYDKYHEDLKAAKVDQIVDHYGINKEDFMVRFTKAINSGTAETDLKNEYKKYINERMNALPENQRSEENFIKECTIANFALKNLVAPVNEIPEDKMKNLNYGGMNKDEFKKFGHEQVSIKNSTETAIDEYRKVAQGLKDNSINKKDATLEAAGIIKKLEADHAKRGLWERFKDWFRSRGVDSVSKALRKDFMNRTGISKDDLNKFINGSKPNDILENHANECVSNQINDMYFGGINKEIENLPMPDVKKIDDNIVEQEAAKEQEKEVVEEMTEMKDIVSENEEKEIKDEVKEDIKKEVKEQEMEEMTELKDMSDNNELQDNVNNNANQEVANEEQLQEQLNSQLMEEFENVNELEPVSSINESEPANDLEIEEEESYL